MTTKILITGGAGFIGSNLFNKLKNNKNYLIDVVDNLTTGKYSNIEDIDYDENFYYLSFDDLHILENIKRKKYDYVFHLAALPSVPYSVEYPYKSFDVNVSKTIKLMEACRGNVKKFIFASSCSVYGDTFKEYNGQAIDESAPCIPSSPYAQQKLNVEEWLSNFQYFYGLNYVSYRFFNVYGPYQLGDSAYSNVISSWLNNIKLNKPLRIDGDGEQRRDFVYVDDIVNILIETMEKDFSIYSWQNIYNIGTGTNFSCNDVFKLLKNNNKTIISVNAPERPGDIKITKAEISKLKTVFPNYKFINFEDGLNETIKWWNNGCK